MRVFSLRGAHLLAMFARTPKAKEFRRWVLDILDCEVAEQTPVRKPRKTVNITEIQAANLYAALNMLDGARNLLKTLYPSLVAMKSAYANQCYDYYSEMAFGIGCTRAVFPKLGEAHAKTTAQYVIDYASRQKNRH